MTIRIPRRADQDLRDYPTYTIPEAAKFLAIPKRTLQYWVYDKPMWRVAGSEYSVRLLSFRDLAQSYFIDFIRKHVGLSNRKAREILEAAKQESRSKYPLLGKNVKVLFKHVVFDKPALGRFPRRVVDLSQHRQLVFQEVVDLFATRIEWDSRNQVARIFPWKHLTKDDVSRPVTIDPNVMSGRLVITGTRIPVEIVLNRKLAGESVPDLARDYALRQKVISDALRHLGLPKAA